MTETKEAPPTFDFEMDERRFWEAHDSTDYVDWRQAKPVKFPNLKRTISAAET